MSSRHLSRTTCDTSFNCSQQSILKAIDRFLKSVDNMDSTVLVPNKIRDMELNQITSCNTSTKRKTSQCKPPTILHNTDLYAFYLMLHDIKKELMWGPTSMSAIASSRFSQSNGSINNICSLSMSNSSFNTNCVFNSGSNYGPNYNAVNSLSKFGNSSNGNSTNTLSGLSYQSYKSNQLNGLINNSVNSSVIRSTNGSTNGSTNCSTTSSTNSSTTGSTNGLTSTYSNLLASKYSSPKDQKKHHSRQPSDDSSVSLGSAGSAESSIDIDSESDFDSVLADRESSNSQTSDEHTLHLAAAFKHHLQGLHQILDTLTNTADFFCARYQEEVDVLTEN